MAIGAVMPHRQPSLRIHASHVQLLDLASTALFRPKAARRLRAPDVPMEKKPSHGTTVYTGEDIPSCRSRAAPRPRRTAEAVRERQSSADAEPGRTPPPGTAAALRVTPDRRVPGVMLAVTHKTAVSGAELKEKPCRTETLAEHVVTLLQCNTKGGHPWQ